MELFEKTLAHIFPVKASWLVFVSRRCSRQKPRRCARHFPEPSSACCSRAALHKAAREKPAPLSAARPEPVRTALGSSPVLMVEQDLARWGQRNHGHKEGIRNELWM
ncbi:unnamed protein product [Coccothraustes coccothraustes]